MPIRPARKETHLLKALRNAVAVILTALFLLTGCSLSNSSSSETPTSVSSTRQTPSTNAPSGTPGAGQSTPSGTPEVIILYPPFLIAHAASGTQKSNFGSYYWMIDSGLADQAHARGIEIQKSALEVKKGETVQFTWDQQNAKSDSTLQDLTISVYPEQSSIETVTVAQGTMKGFKASGTPVTSGPLPTTNPSWAANIDSGSYFVLIKATWSNPVVPAKIRNCEYGFFFKVG